MATGKMVAVKDFCKHHNITIGFISELQQHEIVELVVINRTKYIPLKNLVTVEKVVRLYNDLQINIQGIHTILQLLSHLERKEAEITSMKNELAFYTSGNTE